MFTSTLLILAAMVGAGPPFPANEEPKNSLEVIARAQQSAGTKLVSDPTLAKAASCLATAGKGGQRLDAALIRRCTELAEVYDSALVPLLGEAAQNTDLLTSLVPYFRDEAKKRGLTHYGAASIQDGQRRILAVIATLRRGTLDVTVDCKTKRMKVQGVVEPGHKNVRAFLTDTRGLVGPLAIALDRDAFSGEVPVPVPGRYQVEVLGDQKDGPHVVANLAVFACAPRPKDSAPAQTQTHTAPDDRLLALMNDARRAADLRPLAKNEKVAAVAAAHAEDMKKQSYFAHNDKKGGTLGERLKAANIAFNRAAENLSSAPTADDAHQSLMTSPGHRKNILDPELTDAGIGVVTNPLANGEPNLLFVIDFITPPKSTTADAFAEELLTVLNQLRAQHDLSPLVSDPRLKQLAMEHAQAMAASETLAYQPNFLGETRGAAGAKDVDTDLFVTNDVDVVRKSANAEKPAKKVAIGVAQRSTKRYGEGMFFVTVIYVR